LIPIYKLCSRKLIVMAVVVVFSTIFYVMNIGNATFQQWAEFIKWIVGIYIAGNIMSKPFNRKNKGD